MDNSRSWNKFTTLQSFTIKNNNCYVGGFIIDGVVVIPLYRTLILAPMDSIFHLMENRLLVRTNLEKEIILHHKGLVVQ